MDWGTVYWDKARNHPYFAVSSRYFLQRSDRVLLVQGTLHSASKKKAYSSAQRSRFRDTVPIGEAVVVYADPTNPDYYPNAHDLHLSLAQGCQISYAHKSDINRSQRFRRIHRVDAAYFVPLRQSIRAALRGLAGAPPRSSPPTERAPLADRPQGALVRAVKADGTELSFVVCSHASVHSFYPVPAVVLLPVHDLQAPTVLRRYAFDQVFSLSAYGNMPYSFTDVDQLPGEEMLRILETLECCTDPES